MEVIYEFRSRENDPGLNFIIFTEFVETLGYFGVVEEVAGKVLLKKKLMISEEQTRIMIQLYAKEIIQAHRFP